MPFQPICVACLGDCDRGGGGMTSCHHFLCSRCLARLPSTAPCPACAKPYQLARFDQPNSALSLLLVDSATSLGRTGEAVYVQLRHYEWVIRRMRQALTLMQRSGQEASRQRQQAQAACEASSARVQALEAEVGRLRDELHRATSAAAAAALADTRASAARAPSHAPYPPPHPPPPPAPAPVPQSRAPSIGLAGACAGAHAARPTEVCQTPRGQTFASRAGPDAAAACNAFMAGRAAPPREPWPAQPSPAAVSRSPSTRPAAHPPHHPHGHAGASAVASLPPSARPVPPLGWSASSLISKRPRSESCAAPLAALGAPTASALTGFAPARLAGHHLSAVSADDFRIGTPLVASLHPHAAARPRHLSSPSHSVFSPVQRSGGDASLRSTPKALQRLFSSPHGATGSM